MVVLVVRRWRWWRVRWWWLSAVWFVASNKRALELAWASARLAKEVARMVVAT